MENNFFNLNVVETECGRKWVDIDSLIMNLHYRIYSLESDLDKSEKNQDEEFGDTMTLDEDQSDFLDFDSYISAMNEVVEVLEEAIKTYDELKEK